MESLALPEPGSNPLTMLRDLAAPVVAPLGTAAVVIVFVIFMLLEREDLRDRFIHLIGRQRLHLTTQALDDAGKRISRYLLAQLIVNTTYGIPIGIGLYFIGIPNAILWGLLATVLRFIPYIGPWIASAFPIALSLAIAPSWTAPLLTLGLFLVVELISNRRRAVALRFQHRLRHGDHRYRRFSDWLGGTAGYSRTPRPCAWPCSEIHSSPISRSAARDAPPMPGDRLYQRF